MTEDELRNKQKYSTYLDGLRDALEMTKPQLRKAIEFILNDDSWMSGFDV